MAITKKFKNNKQVWYWILSNALYVWALIFVASFFVSLGEFEDFYYDNQEEINFKLEESLEEIDKGTIAFIFTKTFMIFMGIMLLLCVFYLGDASEQIEKMIWGPK